MIYFIPQETHYTISTPNIAKSKYNPSFEGLLVAIKEIL